MQSPPWAGPEYTGTIQRFGAIGWTAKVTHAFLEDSTYCFTRRGAERWVRRTIRSWKRDDDASVIRIEP